MIMVADKLLDAREDQETFGGIDMIVRRNAFGRQNESFEAAIDVAGIPGGPVEGVFIRAPWVESVGGAVEVLATYDGHTVAVRQGNVLATSFHPELTGDHRVHALFVDMVRRAQGSDSVVAGRRAGVTPCDLSPVGSQAFVSDVGYAKETGGCPATLNGLRRSTRRP